MDMVPVINGPDTHHSIPPFRMAGSSQQHRYSRAPTTASANYCGSETGSLLTNPQEDDLNYYSLNPFLPFKNQLGFKRRMKETTMHSIKKKKLNQGLTHSQLVSSNAVVITAIIKYRLTSL